MALIPVRAVDLGRQAAAIRGRFRSAEVRLRGGQLTGTLDLQPTPASKTYTVRLTYRPRQPPSVTVLAPKLRSRESGEPVPHVHSADEPCLYYRDEWNDTKLLASTILPWAAEWLQFYELWHVTGVWLGGGVSHERGWRT